MVLSNTQWFAAAVLGLALATTPVAATEGAEAEPEATEPEKTEKVDKVEYVEVRVPYAPRSNTIATKLPVPTQRTPAGIGAVTSALLAEQNAFVLGDALRNVSGMNLQAGSGVHDYFGLRGFNSLDGALVLTDGAAEPEVSFYDLYNIDGVEVFKGPTGFLYGGGPLAGTVNLIRKQPLPGDLLVIGAQGGSFGTVQGNLDWNTAWREGDSGFRLNGFWREADNFRDAKDSTHHAINPSYVHRFGDSTVNVNLEVVEADYMPDSGIPLLANALPAVDRETNYQSPFDYSEQDQYRFQVDYQTALNEKVTLRNKLYYRQLDWQTFGTLFFGTVGPPQQPLPEDYAIRSSTVLDDTQRFAGNQFEALISAGGRVTHNVLFGLEVARNEDDFDFGLVLPCENLFFGSPGCMPAISVLNPVETATAPGQVPFLIGDSTTTVVAPYAIDQIRFSEQWELMLGARYDDIDTEVDFAVNGQFLCGNGYSRSDGELSPMAGLVFAPDDDLSLYANAGQAFAPVGPRVLDACSLEPEESRQVELGAKKHFLQGKVHSSAAVYRIERDNIAIPDDNGVTQQAGDQRSEGIELDVAAELPSRLRLFFSYAYNDAELTRFNERIVIGPGPGDFIVLDRSGNAPAFAPKNLASIWLATTFSNGLGIGGGPRFVGEQFIAEDNAYAIDDYVVWDATVFYDLDSWRLKLNLKNFTDEDYESRGFGSASVIPANPFAVYAGVEYRP